MAESSFQFAFYGEGYTEEQDPTKGKPNAKIRTLIQGPGNSESESGHGAFQFFVLFFYCTNFIIHFSDWKLHKELVPLHEGTHMMPSCFNMYTLKTEMITVFNKLY